MLFDFDDKPPAPPPVVRSGELERILVLPRRVLDLEKVPDVTPLFRRTGGTMCFWPIQSAALVEAAEAGGLFAAVGVGGGKCISGDTEIYDVESGSRRTARELGAFVVASVSRDNKAVGTPSTAFYSGVKDCVRLTLASGDSVVLSTDHPVRTQRGWVPVKELRSDDLVATPRRLPEPELYTQVSDDLVKLVSYLMSDGGCTAGISFTNADAALLSEFSELVDVLGVPARHWGVGTTVKKDRGENKATTFMVQGVTHIVREAGIKTLSKNKRVPANYYGLPADQIALFLNRFWACDGHVNVGHRRLEITLASEGLVDDLKFLLLRLGVFARKAFHQASYVKNGVRKLFPSWKLVVSEGSNVLRFLDAVGPILSKERACADLREMCVAHKANPNVDVVPVGVPEFHVICSELGMQGRGGRASRADRPRTSLRKLLGITSGQHISRQKFESWVESSGYSGQYAWLAHSDLIWQHVKSAVPVGEQEVFDISAPETECFVGGGIVLHNSLISYALPEAMNSKVAVLLVPANLKNKAAREIPEYSRHFRLPVTSPGRVHIVAMTTLSSPKHADILDRLAPDLIIVDECFPYATQVLTEQGLCAIGELVESGRAARVLSWNPSTAMLEWKRVAKGLRKYLTDRLVRVTHGFGELICTASHKVWTEGRGYVRAEDLQSTDSIRICQTSDREDLCLVREAVHSQIYGSAQRPEDLLLQEVQQFPRGRGDDLVQQNGLHPGEEGRGERPHEGAGCGMAPRRGEACATDAGEEGQGIHSRAAGGVERARSAADGAPASSKAVERGAVGRGESGGASSSEILCTDQMPALWTAEACQKEGKNYSDLLLSLLPQRTSDGSTSEEGVAGEKGEVAANAGRVDTLYGLRNGDCSQGWNLEAGVLSQVPGSTLCRAHDHGQPYEETRSGREDERVHAGSDVPGAGRQRAVDRAAEAAGGTSWLPDGIRHQDGTGPRDVSVASQLLQGGSGYSGGLPGYRGGRIHPQVEEVEVLGSPENISSFCVRVDRVEVLERGSAEEHRLCGGEGYVYDLEVEDNHNYVASGVVVSNCHMLAHPNAARTKRFLRYFRQNPHCRFAGMSGSITKKSLIDYAHLLELALRKNSPVPFGYHERLDWAGALDVKPREPKSPGALLRFCKPGETVREGFRRRLIETLGVVATGENKLNTGLIIKTPIPVQVPVMVTEALKQVRKTWSIGDDEFDSILTLHRVLRQVACGFHYQWVPPVDKEWVEARKRWHREVRSYLTHSSRAGMDSPFLLTMAAANGKWPAVTWPDWQKVKHIKPPEVEAIWLSDFLVKAAVKWGQDKRGAIVWYQHVALGEAIAKMGGWPLYDGGTDAGLATPGKQPVIVCSMKAQGTGKNLQGSAEVPGYWQNLLTSMPSGLDFEQIVGRTHREGQSADDVTVEFFSHTPELQAAWQGVLEDSRYVKETTGNTYRVLDATIE